jgi:hypothetical protein
MICLNSVMNSMGASSTISRQGVHAGGEQFGGGGDDRVLAGRIDKIIQLAFALRILILKNEAVIFTKTDTP